MEVQESNNMGGVLAPEGNKCMCCGKDITHGEKANYFIPIYKEEDRTNLLVYRSVTYRKIGVIVTRCANCKKIQKKAELISIYFSFGIGLGIAAIGAFLCFFSDNMSTLGILLIVSGILAGALLCMSKGEDRATDYLDKKKVLSKEDAAIHYKEVAELIRDGWSFSEPEVDNS